MPVSDDVRGVSTEWGSPTGTPVESRARSAGVNFLNGRTTAEIVVGIVVLNLFSIWLYHQIFE